MQIIDTGVKDILLFIVCKKIVCFRHLMLLLL